MKKFNWPIWAGVLLTIVTFVSYSLFFVYFPVTRDFPWANLLLFAIAAVLLLVGVRRAFSAGRSRKSKVGASIATALSVLIIAFFVLLLFILGRQLPASAGAPKPGTKAPDFTLADANGKQVSLAGILSEPINGQPPKGALLVFYRGYW